MEKENLDSWDGFLGSNYLKVEDLKNDNPFICIGVELDTENKRPVLVLEKDMNTYKFSLNVTNSNYLKSNGISTPKMTIGKKIFFGKIMVTNPQTKKMQESLRITKIE